MRNHIQNWGKKTKEEIQVHNPKLPNQNPKSDTKKGNIKPEITTRNPKRKKKSKLNRELTTRNPKNKPKPETRNQTPKSDKKLKTRVHNSKTEIRNLNLKRE